MAKTRDREREGLHPRTFFKTIKNFCEKKVSPVNNMSTFKVVARRLITGGRKTALLVLDTVLVNF